MKKYVMNKNVMHDGKNFVKGEELSKGHPGFDSLVAQGHADEMVFKSEAASEDASAEEPSFPEESEKPAKKHGRK